MYVLSSAVGKSTDLDGKYYPIDLSQISIKTALITYPSIIAKIYHTSDNTKMYYLDLGKLPYKVRKGNQTLSEFFIDNGNNILPTTDNDPVGAFIMLRFADVWLSDFDVKPANRAYHPDMSLTIDMQRDVLISKAGVDYGYQARRVLATVNGFIHRVDNTPQGLLILDGGTTARIGDANRLGLLDFSQFGKITTISITDEMIYSRGGAPLKESVGIALPVDLRSKTVLLVLAGHLIYDDSLLSITGINSVKMDMAKYNWLRKYYDTKDKFDYSPLGIDKVSGDRELLESLYSDTTITNLFKLSQSFIVVIDHIDLHMGTSCLEDTDIPGEYVSRVVPIAPILHSDGRLMEYRYFHEEGKYAITTGDYMVKQKIFESGRVRKNMAFNDAAVGKERHKMSGARFLMISKTLMGS
jgi:hypothetical protein